MVPKTQCGTSRSTFVFSGVTATLAPPPRRLVGRILHSRARTSCSKCKTESGSRPGNPLPCTLAMLGDTALQIAKILRKLSYVRCNPGKFESMFAHLAQLPFRTSQTLSESTEHYVHSLSLQILVLKWPRHCTAQDPAKE